MSCFRPMLCSFGLLLLTVCVGAQDLDSEDGSVNGADALQPNEMLDAISNGDAASQELALKFYYDRLYASPDSREAALAMASSLEPYIVDPQARAEFQMHVSAAYRLQGDFDRYSEMLDRLADENPDLTTEAGYLAAYERTLDLLRVPNVDYGDAVAAFESLLPYSEQISDFQRGRIGVQLTNVYRNNRDFNKAIVLAELTRNFLAPDDSNGMTLLSDLAAAYFATENYDLAALTFDELAELVRTLNPNPDPAEEAATWLNTAPEMARRARALAEEQRILAGAARAAAPASAPSVDDSPVTLAKTSTNLVVKTEPAASSPTAPAESAPPVPSDRLGWLATGMIGVIVISGLGIAIAGLTKRQPKVGA